jgi:16S rRNA G966 N2-methylase RsmD
MANISKIKRDKLIELIKNIKKHNKTEEFVSGLNQIINELNNKKYGLMFEEHEEEVDERLKKYIPVLIADNEKIIQKDGSKPFNFIIEGDNLQALHILEKTHKGKIDCIYIDPPYNTGARDWKYNNDYVDEEDAYRHSKWLSMMKKRLMIAKRLLNNKDSVLICSIDDKEYLRLGLLLEEIFPQSKITMISSVINPAGKAKKGGVDFSRIDEYIFFLQIGKAAVLPETRVNEKTPIAWETFRRHSLANGRGKHGIGASGPNQFYPIYVNNSTKKIVEIGIPIMEGVSRFSVKQLKGCTAVFPVRDNGIEMNWGAIREEALNRLSKGYLKVGKYSPNAPQQYSIQYLTSGVIKDIENEKVTIEGIDTEGGVIGYYLTGRAKVPTTAWNKPSHNATSYGTDILNKIFKDSRFDYPKSIYAVRDCLALFVSNKPNALILDFFAGSGTSLHAVNLLNLEDNGNRQCIMITNNEVSELDQEDLISRGFKKGDKEWEERGIAKNVTWPRTFGSIEGKDVNGNKLDYFYGVEYEKFEPIDKSIGENNEDESLKPSRNVYKKVKAPVYLKLKDKKMEDGFNSNVKYFKCDWIERNPEDYLLSNLLAPHVKEMIELQTGTHLDNIKYLLILNKKDFNNFVVNSKNKKKINHIWVNQNIIFNAKEKEILDSYNNSFIPKYYFGEELKGAAE